MFAVPGIDKTYKMLAPTSTVGGWLLSLELHFSERYVDLRKKLGDLLGLAGRLVQLE